MTRGVNSFTFEAMDAMFRVTILGNGRRLERLWFKSDREGGSNPVWLPVPKELLEMHEFATQRADEIRAHFHQEIIR